MRNIDKLLNKNISLASHSSFEIGGEAAYFAMPESFDELREILVYCQRVGQEYFYFGNGSNLLFPDQPDPDTLYIGLHHLVELEVKSLDGGYKIHMHAGTPMAYLAGLGLRYGLEDLYFTHLLPGTLGAGIYINAKCYDDQICNILDYVYYLDTENPGAGIQKVPATACEFSYKKSIFQTKRWLICGADLKTLYPKGEESLVSQENNRNIVRKVSKASDIVDTSNTSTASKKNKASGEGDSSRGILSAEKDGQLLYSLDVASTMADIYQGSLQNIMRLPDFYKYFQGNIRSELRTSSGSNLADMVEGLLLPDKLIAIDKDRNAKHHFTYPSCGSVFKNNYDHGRPMGAVIDDLGIKGMQYGGAMISPHHGNFIINYQGASAQDVRYLISYIQDVVDRKHGFVPEPEVVLVK